MHKEIEIIAFYFKETIYLVILVTVNMKIVIVPLSLYGQSNLLRITLYIATLRSGSPAPSVSSFWFLGILIQ